MPLLEGTPGDKIAAEYRNGVLEILIPRPTKEDDARKPKTIPTKGSTPANARLAANA